MTDVGQNRKTGERKPMKELQKQLDMLIRKSGADMQVIEMIRNEPSVFPFSTEGKLMAYLLAGRIITYEEYLNLNREYNRRNQYLYLFDMAPRTFGEIWGENHILQLFPEFVKATKEKLMFQYPGFDGEFDLLLDGIRVEVKACRANSTKFGGNLASRAYLHQEAHEHAFKYHYQQLKPSCCDVFLWIGVCRDELLYWVISSEELIQTRRLGTQHRNEKTGTLGVPVYEGQIFMTEEELRPYLTAEKDIVEAVRRKGRK